MIRQSNGLFYFEPWMINNFSTIELTGYYNDEIPDDQVSIRKFDTIGNYFKKFHKKLGDPNDDEVSNEKIWAGPHSDGSSSSR